MTTILAFGADGQVGRELAECASRRRASICLLDRAEADIANAEAVREVIAAFSPAIVVNAAAYTNVDRAESEPEAAYRANASGPGVLAAACARAGIPLLHISTDYVFDGTKRGAYVESNSIAPLGVYGRSKADGETNVRRELERHVIIRTSWVYGVYGANFLKTILRLARECEELRIVADQYGCPTGAADIAEAILTIVPRLASGEAAWGTYHFAGQGTTTWHGFATEIVEAQTASTNRRPVVVAVNTAEYLTPARRPANSELDSSRFAATFGFKAWDWRMRARQVTSALATRVQV